MNVFNQLRVYAAKWQVSERRKFSKEEIATISSAVVVPSEYGTSVCFSLVSGGNTYIPLSTESRYVVGENIDPARVSLVTLSREGNSDILRVE